MAKLLNVNAWMAKTQQAKEKIKTKASVYVRQRVRIVLKDAVTVSPQWSGNFAANWQIETNARPSTGWDSMYKPYNWRDLSKTDSVRQQGDKRAINYVLNQAEDVIASIKYNSQIRLVNNTVAIVRNQAKDLDAAVRDGVIRLREENRAFVGAGKGVTEYLKMKYRYLA